MRVADSASIASRIEQAFQTASADTGASFDYLVKTAMRESSMDTTAKAKTSSATGLFQFVEGTWLETMKESGAELGLGQYADQISRTSRGKYVVNDPQARQEILALRKDPEISSLMAGALTQKNAETLTSKLGRSPSEGELYMAHFLGATGASRLINAASENGTQAADQLFPTQARANKAIFYNRDGSSRSNAEVYAAITSKHDAVTMIADAASGNDSGSTTAAAFVPVRMASGTETGGGASQDETTQRVISAFQAAQSSNPFEALFRNSVSTSTSQLGHSFASAYSASEEAPLFTRLSASASKVAAQEFAANSQVASTAAVQELYQQGPLDLTKFLSYASGKDKKDLLPPV
ncbi:lytic transglycosylase domain-containing protein [Roseibium sp. CAU 1637]|uniref:Lytic transglycosylase domain-containing protein n=1 Tax=Roseibium limicola TaxID=2816037 RepID=A0A939ELK9_9HYPH|nr:lytic transglycosylase domain-containing protein [Roseibium limicola]MBO0344861.1 lytic transglycosylase domain-containing protein [Roseibium limicola]